MSQRPIRRALISVSDKTGLLEFAESLARLGVEILSTGGTSKALKDAGLNIIDVSDVTGFPEIMDGRVKTLHPAVHGGLLAIRDDASHEAQRKKHGIEHIDLLCVNLYPFEATVKRGASFTDTIENIDVGGPAMIRGAAKNHHDVTVVVDVSDYDVVLAEMAKHNGATLLKTRQHLAAKAFARTAAYDTAIARWFDAVQGNAAPAYFTVGGAHVGKLRYGENPHQSASVYRTADQRRGILDALQLQGKELSYNNINDADAALDALSEFTNEAACVIVKHANPCGVALGKTLHEAYLNALRCDQTSAFGGIIALNKQLDAETASEISKIFTEVIVAPGASEEAKAIMATKKNLRLLILDQLPDRTAKAVMSKTIIGGLLMQSRDDVNVDAMDLRVVTKRQPNPDELRDLKFAFRVAKHVKSNAIVFARDGQTVGIGAGQMSRIDSTRIAVRKSEDAAAVMDLPQSLIKGAVLASDAFFPFPDGLIAAADAGATAIIQPGGAMKDDEVIAAADARGLAMIFTGYRHFKH